MAEILICDDERNLRQLIAMTLLGMGHKTVTVADGEEAISVLEKAPIDLVVTDLKMPKADGLEILRRSKGLDPARPVILITAFASAETAVTAMKEGAFDYLEKPFIMEDLKLAVSRALESADLKRENVRLKQALEETRPGGEVIGAAPSMQRIFALVERLAKPDTTVLITGESGSGKEVIARRLHRLSPRAEGPFIAINCGAIPENLIESELFGHLKGAFTGAAGDRKGLFVEADGGTLFLDEIGETPASVQVKLLRALQERTIRPVGGSEERKVDVRLLAATNRDLTDEVKEGRFREDLYYRINVVNLDLPPLRQRREDIPLLAAHFIEKFSKRHDLPVRSISAEALDCLRDYAFPGNIRELENLIEGMVSLALGETIGLEDLPDRVKRPPPDREATLACLGELPPEGIDLEGTVAALESQLMQKALERAGGVKTKAAALLGLSFRSFRYRFAKLAGRGAEGAAEEGEEESS